MNSQIRRLEIAPPGGRPVGVRCALGDVVDESKRCGGIDRQDRDLTTNQTVLAEGTRVRNKELWESLQSIGHSIAAVEERIRAATKEREVMAVQLRARLEEQFREIRERFDVKLQQDFDVVVKEAIPPVVAREVEVEDDVKHYVNSVVPVVVEKQSGEVHRKLKKAHESFDIENAKIRKREQKILVRFEEHMLRTAQSFEDETSTRIGKLRLLEEDVRERDEEFMRSEEKSQNHVKTELRDIRDRIAVEEQAREEEDCTLLDSMLEAQKELQRIILDNFGSSNA